MKSSGTCKETGESPMRRRRKRQAQMHVKRIMLPLTMKALHTSEACRPMRLIEPIFMEYAE